MKQTLTIALLFFVWQAGFCQVKKQVVSKDSVKVLHTTPTIILIVALGKGLIISKV